MGKILDLDSPVMRFLGRLADLLWLNLLTILLCIPVITAGSAFTALHFSCLKMVRNEESYITKDFFRSFKENFKQSTVIWLIILLLFALLFLDYKIMFFSEDSNGSLVMLILFLIITVIYIFTLVFIFPVQCHFINPIKKTIKNAFLISIMSLPKTILMIILYVLPLVIWYFVPAASLLCWLFWFSAPTYVSAMLYNKIFKRFEPEAKDSNDDFSWSVSKEGEEEEKGPETDALTDFLAEKESGADLEINAEEDLKAVLVGDGEIDSKEDSVTE